VTAQASRLGSLAPLRHTVFRWIWLASLASQLGTWIQNVGAVDQMTLLAPTALLLALIQTATSLPGLLLALPAGALADMVDRRRLLLAASGWMSGASALLALLTFAHVTSAWLLLAATFAIGLGTVAGLPAWQAIIPDLIPRGELAPAVTLSSVAINLARATGPAIGGVAVALAGPGAAFGLTAVAFAMTTVVILEWRRPRRPATLRTEGMAAAVRFGLRYSLLNAPVRRTLLRAASFILFASSLWALMPAVSREFGAGFAGYSGLLGSLGVGAVTSGVLLTWIRRIVAPDPLVVAASLVFAAVSVGVTAVPSYWFALVLMPAAGMAWVCGMSTFNVSVQLAAPAWVRGRVLASYQMTQAGSLAIGSAVWGGVATRLGVAPAMAIAALVLGGGAVVALRWRLPGGERPAADIDGGLAGRRLGSYLLEAPVGEGVLGEVYVARHAALEAQRAVKAMKAGPAGHPLIRDAFLRGARSAARLRHPNVVPVYDCGIEDGVPYLVMPYVDSLTLEQHLERVPAARRAGDPTIRQCVRDVAAALDHAHANGVVHGDLKAANVLVSTRDGRAMVGGFAVAPVPAGAPEPTPAGDVAAFAAVLGRLAGGLVLAPEARHRTAGALAEAYLAARPAPVAPASRRWAGGATRGALAAATAGLLLGTAVITAAALAAQGRPAHAELALPVRGELALPVHGELGEPVAMRGLRLTVVSAVLDAPAPASASAGLGPGDRLVIVQVRYEASRAAAASPYDWVLTDASGAAYGATAGGLDGALPELPLGPSESMRGAVAFAVPRSAQGLVLHFDAEAGDETAEVPLD
jgi:MFS family permease